MIGDERLKLLVAFCSLKNRCESTGASISKNGVLIRLTTERWGHITYGHPQMAEHYFTVLDTIREPEAIYAGNSGELLAVKTIAPGRAVVVCYREQTDIDDGFVITAYPTSNIARIERRSRVWPQ